MNRDKDPAVKKNLTSAYKKWQDHNKLSHTKFIAYTVMFVMTFMIFFDYLFLAHPKPFQIVRVLSLLIISPVYLFSLWVFNQPGDNLKNQLARSFCLCLPLYVINIAYFDYVFFINHEKMVVYFTGLLLVTFFSTFMLHRFWREQYIYNLVFSSMATYLCFTLGPEMRDYLYITIIVHMSAAFVAAYYRREFVGNLYAKYNLFRMMVPEKIATYLSVTDGGKGLGDVFNPKDRFTVCLCCDWRNFQKLCSQKTSDEISHMLEEFYNIVLAKLEELVPDHNYYFNWSADELFIVFFNDDDRHHNVLLDALIFAEVLATDIFATICEKYNEEIMYDIGIAAGIGTLGLQGPTRMKKTTIAGEVAGRAKRLESEAKLHRGLLSFNRHNEDMEVIPPIVIMDETLYIFARDKYEKAQFERIIAQSKDIKSQAFYKWHPPGAIKKIYPVRPTGSD